jgi:hypothetical protein
VFLLVAGQAHILSHLFLQQHQFLATLMSADLPPHKLSLHFKGRVGVGMG